MDAMLTGDESCKANLTPNECAMVLTHAYKKVLRVQKELAIVQVGTGKVPVKQQETIC
jgi:hypothetical protein